MYFSKGSEWRRWDLHVHTMGTLKEDDFKSLNSDEFCITLFRKALKNEIAVIGITDYFSIDNYKKVNQFVEDLDKIDGFTDEEKSQIRKILLIPNVELRMLPSTGSGRMINIHCLFNPEIVDSLENHFFGSLDHSGGSGKKYKMNRQGLIDLGKSFDLNLNDQEAYQKGISIFTVTHGDLQKLKDGDRDFRENVIIAVSNSNKDGASGLQKHYDMFEGTTASSLDGVRKAIYKISDCIFSSNPKDAEYFSGKGKDKVEIVELKCGTLKPCVHGSDAHTEEKLFNPDQGRYCWIKADPTFNGLRQILYEPFPGDRVWIGPTRPDQKDDFKIIKKIEFRNTSDFPQEIIFNPNLCSIIGSRSAGKSALLAYIADAVDSEQARSKKMGGPGEGFPWDDVNFDYSIEWSNGLSNDESPGKIVYIPQNFLFDMGGKPQEINNKILPVLNKKLPQIGTKYTKVNRDIKGNNIDINNAVVKWFREKNQIEEVDDELKNLGAKKSVQTEKTKIDNKITLIKDKYKLKAADIKQHQILSEQVSTFKQRISQINDELGQIGEEGKKGEYFRKSEISLIPSVGELPDSLQEILNQKLEKSSLVIVSDANHIVSNYNTKIGKELIATEGKLNTATQELVALTEKQAKNEELESLIKKSGELKSTLAEIKSKNKKLLEANRRLSNLQNEVIALLSRRVKLIKDLIAEIQSIDQSDIKDMSFGIEAEIDDLDIERLQEKVNTRDKTTFVSSRKLEIDKIRSEPAAFLNAIFSGDQKINRGNEKLLVATEALTLSEKILFTAQMEGDRIGGFAEPTMTPGKRALFALRLILAESEDTWPLLIDQPEDDLDSRSIYDEIVPFLREKKRERQIIMVSHNANLVIGADSEQIIVANRHGEDRKNIDGLQFNYLNGSIENKKDYDPKSTDTLRSQGIREHACQILEGGELAFEKRSNRYDINRGR
jgi:hypothetical protein